MQKSEVDARYSNLPTGTLKLAANRRRALPTSPTGRLPLILN
jgi:hypothetical protein